jgi:hypothetical protein
LPHYLGQVVTQLRLLSTEASQTSSDCARAENPPPGADEIEVKRYQLAIAACSNGRDEIQARLDRVKKPAADALTELGTWVAGVKGVDAETRGQLKLLSAVDPPRLAESA